MVGPQNPRQTGELPRSVEPNQDIAEDVIEVRRLSSGLQQLHSSIRNRLGGGAYPEWTVVESLGRREGSPARNGSGVAGPALHRRQRTIGPRPRPGRHDAGSRHEGDDAGTVVPAPMKTGIDQTTARRRSAESRRDQSGGLGIVEQQNGPTCLRESRRGDGQ